MVSDDAKTLLGGILVGDASKYAHAAPAGRDGRCPATRSTLIAPAGAGAAAGRRRAARRRAGLLLPRRDQGRDLRRDQRPGPDRRRRASRPRTRAGTGCGSCVPLLTDAAGRAAASPCNHGAVRALRRHPRRALRDRRGQAGSRTFTELIERHGRGRGCDICKPAVASILASLGHGHILDGEQAALQDTNDHFLANIQRNGTYSVVPRIPGGEITPDKLIVLGEVARDFGLYTKITGGQRIDLLGARVEQLPAIWRRLVDAGFESGHAYGKARPHGEVLRRLDLVPLRRAGLGRARDRAGAALPGHPLAAQDQGGRVRLRPRVRRGAEQGHRRHRHRATAGTSTSAATAASARGTPTCCWPHVDRADADPHHRPVHHVLHPHRRPAAAHRQLAASRSTGAWTTCAPSSSMTAWASAANSTRPMARHVERYEDEWAAVLADPGRLRPLRVLRQRPGHTRPEHRLRLRTRPAAPGRPPSPCAGPAGRCGRCGRPDA